MAYHVAIATGDRTHSRCILRCMHLKLAFSPLSLLLAYFLFENWWLNVISASLWPQIRPRNRVYDRRLCCLIHWLFEEIVDKIFRL